MFKILLRAEQDRHEDLVAQYGLTILFVMVALESGGVPVPGETALIAAGVLAERGDFSIAAVIAVAAAGAIVGDNVGYWIGRVGGRKLLTRVAWLERHASNVLPWSERFFHRHGGKTIFLIPSSSQTRHRGTKQKNTAQGGKGMKLVPSRTPDATAGQTKDRMRDVFQIRAASTLVEAALAFSVAFSLTPPFGFSR